MTYCNEILTSTCASMIFLFYNINLNAKSNKLFVKLIVTSNLYSVSKY